MFIQGEIHQVVFIIMDMDILVEIQVIQLLNRIMVD
jgi:hypothetical protein